MEICRICMDDGDGFRSIFTEVGGQKIVSMIIDCASVEISEQDGLPHSICNSCYPAIEEAYKIRMKCINSDRKFRRILSYNQDSQKPIVAKPILKTEEENDADTENGRKECETICSVETLENLDDGSKIFSDEESQEYEIKEEIYEIEETEYEVDELDEVYEEEYLEVTDNDENSNEALEECLQTIGMEIESIDNEDAEYRNIETDDAKVICCGCLVLFETEEDLRIHSKIVHEPEKNIHAAEGKVFECDVCFRRYNTERALRFHRFHQFNERCRSCRFCGIVLQSIRKKRDHEEKVHGLINTEGNKVLIVEKKRCCGCEIDFKSVAELEAHSEEHKKEFKQLPFNEDQPKVCDICYKSFSSVKTRMKHQLKAREHKFACSICGLKFVFYSQQKIHEQESICLPSKPYACKVCEKWFSTKGNLTSHMTTHSDFKKFKCHICNKVFNRNANLNVHLMRHSDQFNYSCEHCQKKFKAYNNLKNHIKVHTGLKPYGCRYCDKKYGHISDRRRHEITHTGNYPFSCDICSKKFVRRTFLQKHQAKGCEGDKFKCEECEEVILSIELYNEHMDNHQTIKAVAAVAEEF